LSKSVDANSLSHRHQARVRAHAAQKLVAPEINKAPHEFARAARAFLRIEEERLRINARMGAGGRWLAAARSFALDVLVTHAHEAARTSSNEQARAHEQTSCAVVAIGGYGRQELAPCSDLDLLFLHDARSGTPTPALIERTLHLLWDAGLTIGHKSQTVRDCLASARNDPHLQTALIHARLLTGDRALFAQLADGRARLRRKQTAALVRSARRTRDERHLKHEAIIYLQEPNVKEGVGGLRDLHAALWAAAARFDCATLAELHAHGIITGKEYGTVERAYDFLLRVRNALHWLTGRKAERLALDRQAALAAEFGYQATPHLRASEQFMRDYYRRARALYRFSEMIFARATVQAAAPARWFARPRRAQLAEVFVVKDGLLHLACEAERLAQNPLLAFEAVALAQTASVEFSHELQSAITTQLGAIDRGVRHSPAAAQLFLACLRRRGRVGPALRLMHELNLLGRYLPEFARIQLLIQHDLYHHYTIDEHTLRAIAALDELSRAPEHVRPHLSAALAEVEDVALLYLALLLHDIGKGRGRGHIQRGVRLAEKICVRLQLDERSTIKVVNLVRQHVLMAHVSQRRDLRDPRTAADFAAQLGSLDELNMLLLLTYADLNAVAPGVWSEWKGALLQELYTRARTHFTEGAQPLAVADDLTRLKEQVTRALAGELPASAVERHFALLPARYARHLPADVAAAHLRLLAALQLDALVCTWTQHATGHATELTIAARDRRGLFADLAGALAAHGIEILSADLHTRADGLALDTLILREAATHGAVTPHRRPAIERALHAAVAGQLDVPAAVERWRTRNAPRRQQAQMLAPHPAPVVLCSNEIAEDNTVIEVRAADEPGLAYRIASALAACALDISCAKIATEKADALDVFYVTDADGRKLTEATMQAVTDRLFQALGHTSDRTDSHVAFAVDQTHAPNLAR
jgi:[protein-PII] uridylyltransferase